jgi:hypothetical protein
VGIWEVLEACWGGVGVAALRADKPKAKLRVKVVKMLK